MNTSLDSATRKLTSAEPPYAIVNLPNINDKLWDDIKTDGLTLPELGALKSLKGNVMLYLSSNLTSFFSILASHSCFEITLYISLNSFFYSSASFHCIAQADGGVQEAGE